MSGHSKWATIRHHKGIADKKRGKLFSKLIKEITVAVRLGGGEPNNNPRLRRAISEARAQSLPSDTVTRAVKRGMGELDDVTYDELLYEGTGPVGSLFLIEIMTDNKNRSAAEIRKVFERNYGVLSGAGAAAWAFDRRGLIELDAKLVDEDKLMYVAVGAGAEEYELQGDRWHLQTSPEQLSNVLDALDAAGIKATASSLGYVPKNRKTISGDDAMHAMKLVEALEDHDDVQNVYSDFELDGDALAALGQG
jgi:YebC/PmpR family DNA-binding regulatory protein